MMTVFARTYITDDKVHVTCFGHSSIRKFSFLVYTLNKIEASIYSINFVLECDFPNNNLT